MHPTVAWVVVQKAAVREQMIFDLARWYITVCETLVSVEHRERPQKRGNLLNVEGEKMKLLSFTIATVALLGLFVFTNPKMADYERFVRNFVTDNTENAEPLDRALGLLFGGLAGSLASTVTSRHDYVLFSIYNSTLPNNHLKVLGALSNFFVMEQSTLTGPRVRPPSTTTHR